MDREKPVPFTLETERLVLPPLDASRADELAEIYADPEVAAYIGGDQLSPEGTRRQVSAFERVWRERGCGQSAVIERTTGRMLGRVGLHYWPAWDETELGYVLARGAQGRGIAREASTVWLRWADAELPDDYVTAVIHPDNAASIGLATRLGFTKWRVDVIPSGTTVLIFRRDRNA